MPGKSSSLGRSLAEGAVAGTAATAVMTAWMWAASHAGLMPEQPQRRIVRATLLPGNADRRKPGDGLVGQLAHFGFGASMGAVFGLLSARRRPSVLAGVVYGLGVWAVSYEGWIGAAGILPPAHADRPDRRVSMLVAHLPYGATLAFTLRRMRPAAPLPAAEGETTASAS
ncbi:DUF6789 family protein [Actinomadura sp. 21ATH]|uniref:DUF6789 family protein n=1 Tax=Actinomadura sp. 21ATH TaxID=1735444 RepID=UPI0035BFF1F0